MKPSGGALYWRRFAEDEKLGTPVRVTTTSHGYTIFWKRHSESRPYVGGMRKKKKLVADLQRWIDGR